MLLLFALFLAAPALLYGDRLELCGNHFMYKGEHIFLSGGNLPWISYGHDYGNGNWAGVKAKMATQMEQLRDAGGNTLRLWVHAQAESTPLFNSSGYVIGTDRRNTFISDFRDMLDLAQSYDIFVVPTLWTANVDQDKSHRFDGLMVDWRKLESYIEKVLVPLVKAVKDHPALGAWDIINDPEGMIIPGKADPNPCYDTTKLADYDAGWAAPKYTYRQMLVFISWQANAIKKADPGALVTVGAWKSVSNTDSFGLIDHYKDSCLLGAGKRPLGTLDFYQYHSFSWQGKFIDYSPFKHQWTDYNTPKAIVVGAFCSAAGAGLTEEDLFEYIYTHSYSGAWSYNLLNHSQDQRNGMEYIQYYQDNGKITIDL